MAIAGTWNLAPVATYTGKVLTDSRYIVVLTDTTDDQTGEGGIAFGSVDADYAFLDGATTFTAYTVAAGDWFEIGEGVYSLRIGLTEFTAAGTYVVRVGDTTPAGHKFIFVVEVAARQLDDVTSGTGVNVTQISGDTTAADNLELAFDGTGYAGGTIKQGVDVVAISGDATAADNLESYADGTTPIPANATQVSGDSTAADNLEAMFDGAGYAGGTIKLAVDAVAISGDTSAADNLEAAYDGAGYAGGTIKQDVNIVQISGDATAADNLEAYADGTTPIPANMTQISGDATAADNLESYADGTTPQPVNITHFGGSAGSFSSGRPSVNLNLAQAFTEGQTDLTVGGAMELANAARNTRSDSGTTRTRFRTDGTTPLHQHTIGANSETRL